MNIYERYRNIISWIDNQGLWVISIFSLVIVFYKSLNLMWYEETQGLGFWVLLRGTIGVLLVTWLFYSIIEIRKTLKSIEQNTNSQFVNELLKYLEDYNNNIPPNKTIETRQELPDTTSQENIEKDMDNSANQNAQCPELKDNSIYNGLGIAIVIIIITTVILIMCGNLS